MPAGQILACELDSPLGSNSPKGPLFFWNKRPLRENLTRSPTFLFIEAPKILRREQRINWLCGSERTLVGRLLLLR
jgi:hypothetical protein